MVTSLIFSPVARPNLAIYDAAIEAIAAPIEWPAETFDLILKTTTHFHQSIFHNPDKGIWVL